MNNNNKFKILISNLLITASISSAFAVDVPFVGTVVNSCALVVALPGTLDTNTNGNVLSSKEGLGISGQVLATATGPDFTIAVSSPSAFTTLPAGADANSTFASSYSTNGATNTGEQPENVTTNINTGITTVNVDLTATKNSGIYSTGVYGAPVTVTCEGS